METKPFAGNEAGGRWFSEHYDEIFPFRQATLDCLERYLEPAGRVLDIGCGPGRYAARLAARGWEATGIDIDAAMIRRARREHPAVAFRRLDLAEVAALPGPYDGAFALGNVMAFLPPGSWPAFLRDLAERLVDGGVWLFQTVNFDPLIHRREHRFPPLHLPSGEEVLRAYRARDGASVSFRISRRSGARTELIEESVLYPQTALALRSLHETAGYRLVAHLGSFTGEPFDPACAGANIQVWRHGREKNAAPQPKPGAGG